MNDHQSHLVKYVPPKCEKCGCEILNLNLMCVPCAVKQAETVGHPYAYIYEFDSAVFGTHRSFSPSQWNGMKPTRTVAVYTHPTQPVQPAGAQGEPVHFRAVLCSEQHDKALGVVPKVAGFVDKKAAEQFILEQRDFKGWKYNLESLYAEAPAAAVNEQLLEAVRAKILNTPELHQFTEGVTLEALHQRERWGSTHDVGKTPADWFWLVGYLAGKALHAQTAGNIDKALHHTISAAAALANWHAAISGTNTLMRPGIDPADHGIDAAIAAAEAEKAKGGV